MKFMVYRVLVLLLTLGSGFAWAGVNAPEKPVVRVGMMMFPGFSELNEKGDAVGSSVRLTRMLLAQAGYRASISIMPAARIWRGLESGQVHLWPGIVNKPGLEDHTVLTARDLGQVGINLYHRPNEPAPLFPSGLAGKRLILITNYTYVCSLIRALQDPALGLSQVTSTSHVGAVQMLLKGRGDYLLDYRAQINVATRQLGIDPLPSVLVAEQPMRFVLSLQSGFAAQLQADLDRAYDELAAQGIELDVTRQ